MARKSACEKLLDLVDEDPRFMRVGLAGTMLFLRLARLIARYGDMSTLRLGSFFGSWNAVAVWLRVSETELETELQNLITHGLIDRGANSISISEASGLRDRRAEAARKNGRAGGRPVKNPPDSRQKNILYPLAGGVPGAPGSQTQETGSKTQAETLSRGRPLSPEDNSSEEREEAAVLVLLRELAEAGALHQREAGNREAARRWLQSGATAAGLREVFMASLRRTKPPRLAPIGYFDRLAEDLLARPAAAPMAARPAKQSEDPATAELRRENTAMWHRFVDLEQRNGPCPPSMGRWLAGEVPNAAEWRAYITEGRSAFQRAA